jgi:ribonucleoside-diphosphate reductase alpha chain
MAKRSSNKIRAKIKVTQEFLWQYGHKIPSLPKNLFEPQLTATGEYIARNNYLLRDLNGKIVEKPKEMFWRVAHNVATADLLYKSPKEMAQARKEFYQILANLEFVPNTPTFANAGGKLQQLSACFVLPIEDSMISIGQTFVDTIMIHKTGGGTGFSFSKLRPYGSIVRSTGRVSSGAIYFMWMYADATDRVQQGGYRRGANMGVMNVNHPDILRWIMIKSSEFTVNSFNLSVALTDKFMEQVEKDSQFAPKGLGPQKEELDRLIKGVQKILGNPKLNFNERMREFEIKIRELKELLLAQQPGEGYDLVNPDTKKSEGKLNAKKIFELIGRVAWEKGDPGVIFLDRINDDNPTPVLGKIEATNPCGEQPLLPYESCNLGAINLSRMVKKGQDSFGEIDYEKIRATIQKAVHFLDNVIDMNRYPLSQIEQMTKNNRKIGLGVMGWADMLVQLGIPYDSPEALNTASQLMNFIREEARKASSELAKERGVFPNFKGSIYDKRSHNFKGRDLKLRNAALTTIAPTGTTSMLADTSSGIEPYFAIRYEKNIVTGEKVVNLNPFFIKMAKKENFWSEDLVEKIKANKGSLKGLKEIPEKIQQLFPVAADIPYEVHIKMQAAFQKAGVDNAVSKTINMSPEVTPQDVIRSYFLAYNEGCKGVTIYRDRSRSKQILERDESYQDGKTVYFRQLPEVRRGSTWALTTPVGTLHATINEDEEGNPLETFFNVGKAGGDILAIAEGLGRLISLDLRTTPPKLAIQKLQMIVEQLSGIGSSTSVGFGTKKVRSLPDGIANILQNYINEKNGLKTAQTELQPEKNSPSNHQNHGNLCPECGNATLVYEEGCEKCICGYSKC